MRLDHRFQPLSFAEQRNPNTAVVQGLAVMPGGASRPLFLLVQGLTGMSNPSDEVCVTATSMAALGEGRTDYKWTSSHQTAWNHVLVLEILQEPPGTAPPAAVVLQFSVLSPTASGHALLASVSCVCPSEIASEDGGFCDQRLCLRDGECMTGPRLQIAGSYSKADIMMLHRGLLPLSRFFSFEQAPADCSKALMPRSGLVDLHGIGPGDGADIWPDSEAGATDDRNAGSSKMEMLESSIRVLPRLAQIVVRPQSPYKVTNVKLAHTAGRVLRRPPEVGQSIAALGLGKTKDLLEACSHVAELSSRQVRKRAFLYLGKSLLVVQDLPEDEPNLAKRRCRLEVLLLSAEGQEHHYRQFFGDQPFRVLETQNYVPHQPNQPSCRLFFGGLESREDMNHKNKIAGAQETKPESASIDAKPDAKRVSPSQAFPSGRLQYHVITSPSFSTSTEVPHGHSDTEDQSDTEDP